jgi:hypothetical protein
VGGGLVMAAGVAQGATLFTENFEGVVPGGGYGAGAVLGGFTVTGGNVDVLGDVGGSFFSCGTTNNNCVDMSGTSLGTISTGAIFNLVAGRIYTVSFLQAGSGQLNPGDTYTLRVILGTKQQDFTVPALSGFLAQQMQFVAGSNQSNVSLVFQSLTLINGIWGPVLDTVALDETDPAAVPEPSTLVLLSGGLLALGASRLRRQC